MLIRSVLLVALVCCLSSEGKPQTEDKPKGSTVSGIVVYSDTGRPVRHARVGLFSEESQWSTNTISDLRGHFEFEYVPSGKHRLAVEAPGLLSPYRKIALAQTLVPKPRYPDVDQAVTHVSVNGRDSVELKVKAVRGGVITGKVTGEDDQPVPHAEVRLLRRENGKWTPLSNTRSDQNGQPQRADSTGAYRIAGLPSGDYLVRASERSLADDETAAEEDAYSNGSFMVAYYPAATRLKDAQVVSVVTGSETTGIDIRIAEQVPHTLTGKVTFPLTKKPGGYVQIIVERSDEAGFGTEISHSITKTDGEDKWEVSGLPAGEYLVTIDGGAMDIDANGQAAIMQALTKRTTVLIQDERVTVLNTTLTLGAQIVGRMKLEGKQPDEEWLLIVGVVPADKAAASTSVKVQGSYLSFPIPLVNGEGKFAITGLEAGSYWFTVHPIKDADFYVKSVTRKGVDVMRNQIKLTDEVLFDDVVLTLATDFAAVEGQVILPEPTDEQQTPTDITVFIVPDNETTRRFNATRIVEADAKGKLVFRSAPGEYLIAAFPTAYYRTIASEINNEYFEKNAEKFLRLKLRAGEQVKDLRVPVIKK